MGENTLIFAAGGGLEDDVVTRSKEEMSWKSGHMFYSFLFFRHRLFLPHLLRRRGHIFHKFHSN